MKEIIQRMVVYVIIVSALEGLLTNKKYEEYFRFFSGLMMLLMLLLPLLSVFHSSTGWQQRLKENFLALDMRELEDTLKIAEDGFETILMKEYSKALENEVTVMAEEEGVTLNTIEVSLKKKKDAIYIEKISGRKGKAQVVVPTIQMAQKEKKREADSKEVQRLKKKICNRFSVSKKQVYFWE